MHEELVRVNKYSTKITELPPWKRIATDYPIMCRDIVAKKLARVADKLPKMYLLQIDSAYRDRNVEIILWEKRGKLGIVNNPYKGYSSHATGGAVDVSLVDLKGIEVNLSSPFQKYYHEPSLYSDKITKKAQELRLLIYKLMLKEGFAPNPKEYWHFTYGAESWAKYYHKKQLFFKINLNKKYYYGFGERISYRIVRYFFRFLRFVSGKSSNY